jgi:hypothetical protein
MPIHFVRRQSFIVAIGFFFVCSLLAASGLAAAPRVLPAGQTPKDVRLGDLKDLDGYFPFTPARSPEDWNRRAEQVRRQILVSQGCGHAPTTSRRVRQVERVRLPSSRSTAKLSPLGPAVCSVRRTSPQLPGILTPHGHWANSRFFDAGEA